MKFKKNRSAFILAFMVFPLLLSACSMKHAPEMTKESNPSAAETVQIVENAMETNTIDDPAEELAASSRLQVISDRYHTEYMDPENETIEILDFSAYTPAVQLQEENTGGLINEQLGLLAEAWITGNDYGSGASYGEDLLYEIATDKYTYWAMMGKTDVFYPITAARVYSVARGDSKLLSIVFRDTIQGAFDSDYQQISAVSFSLITGEPLALEDIICDTESFCAILEEKLNVDAEEAHQLVYNLSSGQRWFFGTIGLAVVFPEIEEEYITIPYVELIGILKEDYFPEEISCAGRLQLITAEYAADHNIPIRDLIVIDEEGTDLFLYSAEGAYNIGITEYEFNSDHVGSAMLWYSGSLNGEAVQIRVSVPEGQPRTEISVMNQENELETAWIGWNGRQGDIVLIWGT